jgi:hypothetical protein
MEVDALLPPESEKPYFKALFKTQARLGALSKAKTLDGTKWNPITGGPADSEFNKLLDSFRAEDYPTGDNAGTVKPAAKKMMPKTEIEARAKVCQSRVAKATFELVLGETVSDWQEADTFAAIMEAKRQMIEAALPHLTEDAAAILRTIFFNPNPADMENLLVSMQMPADAGETETMGNDNGGGESGSPAADGETAAA